MPDNVKIPTRDGWNTWSDQPAALVYLPLGVSLTPVLYSDRLHKAITPQPVVDMRLGRHDLNGGVIGFETSHGGTGLAFSYTTQNASCVTGDWTLRERGEWGIRYWVVLCLSTKSGNLFQYDADTGIASASVDGQFIAVYTAQCPILVTGHDNVDDLIQKMDTNGYFDLSDRATSAKTLALRFDLEMAPQGRFVAAVSDDRDAAIAACKQEHDIGCQISALQSGLHAGALDAVRDVIGWNTVYDQVNKRLYTTASRIWNMGSFSIWYNDQLFAGLMAGILDSDFGWANLGVAMGNATEHGNFACFFSSLDHWVDRTQAPHGAYVAWSMYLRCPDKSKLELAYRAIAQNHHWWRENRDPDHSGLVSCGTSNVGDAMYKGTVFGARNETGMDNSATHDEATFDPVTGTLSTWDLGLNCALALDAEALALIAAELGRAEDAANFAALSADTKSRIRTELWDETRGIFANRQRNGEFVKSVAPTSFFPLLCGAASSEQAARLRPHLSDPAKFGSPFGLPNAACDDPAYQENIYWLGRVWPNVNFLVWQGLRRYGFEKEATDLARQSIALFNQSWTDDRLCGENYNAETGEIRDRSETDPFYTWGAMLPLMGVLEVMDFTPWGGWTICNAGADLHLGPLESPIGKVTLTVAKGMITLATPFGDSFSTSFLGQLDNIKIEATEISFRFSQACAQGQKLCLGRDATQRFVSAHLDGSELLGSHVNERYEFDLTDIPAGARLHCELRPRP